MATSLKLVWKYIDSTDLDTLDLLNATDGFNLNHGGWAPQSVGEGESSVIDVFNVRASGSSSNALATVLQDLDQYKKRLQWSRESSESRGIYLRTQFSGESNAREAYVYSLDYQINNSIYDFYPTRASTFQDISLTVEHGMWESPSVTSSASNLTISGNIGGSVLWGDTVYGDAPARLAEFTFQSTVHFGAAGKYWFGFKTSRYGTVASNFSPYWPAASGALSNNTSVSNDGNGRTTITCDFATTACLVTRMSINPVYFAPSPSDQRGEYLVLLAAMVDTGTVARARIAYADTYAGTVANPTYRSRVVIDSDLDWKSYEMGSVTIPANRLRGADNTWLWTMRLEVERLSGTGKFYTYGFFLIPLEGMIAAEGAADTNPATIISQPNGELSGMQYNTSDPANLYPLTQFVLQPKNWSLPANDEKPYLIGAVDGKYGGSSSTSLVVSYKYVKRWRTLRGSE